MLSAARKGTCRRMGGGIDSWKSLRGAERIRPISSTGGAKTKNGVNTNEPCPANRSIRSAPIKPMVPTSRMYCSRRKRVGKCFRVSPSVCFDAECSTRLRIASRGHVSLEIIPVLIGSYISLWVWCNCSVVPARLHLSSDAGMLRAARKCISFSLVIIYIYILSQLCYWLIFLFWYKSSDPLTFLIIVIALVFHLDVIVVQPMLW